MKKKKKDDIVQLFNNGMGHATPARGHKQNGKLVRATIKAN